ncbi:hypothetical protein ACLBKT_16035 [Erythrobacter sp. W302b]|uniref:hypothetical protein n=1 Tax=Erythrobacter sp. W302b TaxID=3389874 RepID=UPI00396B0D42
MSDKTIAERLEVKRERRLALIDAPEPLDWAIGAMDRRAELDTADVAVLFAFDRAALEIKLPDLLTSITPSAILWVAYPKLGSPLAGDLNRETVRRIGSDHGMKIVSQIAFDSVWSAMRLKRA